MGKKSGVIWREDIYMLSQILVINQEQNSIRLYVP